MTDPKPCPGGKHQKYFLCPYECGDSRFPRPRWKTEKGFRTHLEKCPNRPEAVYQREAAKLARAKKDEEENAKALDNFLLDYKIGDPIIFISYSVTKQTHEQRFNRMVRVRYEEGRRYYAQSTSIKSIEAKNGEVLINQKYGRTDIWNGDIASAERKASEFQRTYDDWCLAASNMR